MKCLDGNITVLCMVAWFTLSRTPQICPVVLLLDGHGSHIDYYVVPFCVDNLLLFRLPPYSSHAVQPADSFLDRSNQTLVKKLYISFSVQYPQLSITKRTPSLWFLPKLLIKPVAQMLWNDRLGFQEYGWYVEKMLTTVYSILLELWCPYWHGDKSNQ